MSTILAALNKRVVAASDRCADLCNAPEVEFKAANYALQQAIAARDAFQEHSAILTEVIDEYTRELTSASSAATVAALADHQSKGA